MSTANISKKLKESVTVKVLFILFMILLLMIPTFMIRSLIMERNERKSQVEEEVAKSFGEAQRIMLPMIRVPYTTKKLDKNYKEYELKGHINFSPITSKIDGDLKTETRHRSIYDVVVYNSDLNIEEQFKFSSLNLSEWGSSEIDYTRAKIIFGMSDSRGLLESSTFNLNGTELSVKGNADFSIRGMDWVESEVIDIKGLDEIKLKSNIQFKGSKNLKFEPLGESLIVDLKSDWKDPSFVGSSLPESYDITDSSFESHWEVNKFSHSYPKAWSGDKIFNKDYSFGVDLLQPIDEYAKNERTIKYALLIISLTFGIFFFFEILFKKILHPIQYILIGFAVIVFYLLLLSFTEHIGFDKAYLISSFATIGLIVIYTKFILKSLKGSLLIGTLLSALFIYIFIILQMQDFALLAGAIAMFIILATVMILSRNVDWYNLKRTSEVELDLYAEG